MLILWRGQRPHYKNLPDHHLEAKRDCQSRSSIESVEASPTYCFVPFSLHTRVCGQPAYSFCRFGKPFTGFLASAPATTTATYLFPNPAARGPPAFSTANVNSGRNPKLVQSIVLYQNRITYTKRYPTSCNTLNLGV